MLFPQTALVFVLTLFGAVVAQYSQQQYTTPVPILKQINRHNDDGSYSYGYEGADGSFKIETKHPTGEVFGKYGFVDDTGMQRVVEYGASRRGFEPAGTGITVAPPTLNTRSDNTVDYDDDGQYREDPRIYENERSDSRSSNSFSGSSRFNSGYSGYSAPRPQPQAQPQQQRYYQQPQTYQQQPQTYYQQPQTNNYYSQPKAPVVIDPNQFRGHPASNFDVSSGSYSIKYSG